MFPLPEQPTWLIRDSSKLDNYQECPRKYFFTHILGWRSEAPAHDLYFGESWHKAREYQLIHGYDKFADAYLAFAKHYRLKFAPETDEIYRPKDPMNKMLRLLSWLGCCQDTKERRAWISTDCCERLYR